MHHEHPGQLGRLLLGDDDIDAWGNGRGKIRDTFVVEGEDEVRPGLELEPDVVRKVKPGGVLGPDVEDAFLSVANRAVLILSDVERLWPASPDFLGRQTYIKGRVKLNLDLIPIQSYFICKMLQTQNLKLI